MLHKILSDARFFVFLQIIDQHIAESLHDRSCPSCGGKLDVADYWRKPRGHLTTLPQEFERRFSFCCRGDGCRRRATPPSVRFLNRRIYLGVITILVTAMRQGTARSRAEPILRELGIDWHTLRSWRTWWLDLFPQTDQGQIVRSKLRGSLGPSGIFMELWRRLVEGARECVEWAARLANLLVILTPGIVSFGEKFIKNLAAIVFTQSIPAAASGE